MIGINPEVKPGVLALSDNIFVYACGNNIVIHNTIEKTQRYIPSIDGTQGISCMELSHCKRYLAVCERSTQAICIIYDLNTLKRKRVLTSIEVNASEFTSLSFAQSADKLMQYLVTLTNKCNDGQYRCVVWLWDKSRLVTCHTIKLDQVDSVPLTISFNPEDARIVLITGKNLYKYLKLNANFQL